MRTATQYSGSIMENRMRFIANIEYTGFQYEIKYDGVRFHTFALPGQHPAANKEKHRKAAFDCWNSEKQYELG